MRSIYRVPHFELNVDETCRLVVTQTPACLSSTVPHDRHKMNLSIVVVFVVMIVNASHYFT